MFGLFKYRKRLDRRCLSNHGSNYITLIQDQCSLKKFKSLMRDGQQIYYILFHSGLVIGPKNFRILNFSNIFVLRATIQFYSKHQRGKKTLRTFLFWFKIIILGANLFGRNHFFSLLLLRTVPTYSSEIVSEQGPIL